MTSKSKRRSERPSPEAQHIKLLVRARMRGEDSYDPNMPIPKEPITAEEYRTWRRRTVIELVALPVFCPIRRCRRSRRCKGEELLCLEIFGEIVSDRINQMMGWDSSAEDDDDEDLDW